MDKVLDPVEINLHWVCMGTLRYVRGVLMGGLHFVPIDFGYILGCYDKQTSIIYRKEHVTSASYTRFSLHGKIFNKK
jgi:hypothetical protein